MNLLERALSAFKPRAADVRKEAGRTRLRGRVVQDLSLAQQFQRVGGGLTPIQVSQIIRQADTGDMTALIDLANDARQKDGHLHCVLATSEESIAGLEWELELPPNPSAKERKVALWIAEKLRRGSGLTRPISHHAGARFYGYSVSEIMWSKEEGKLVPDLIEAVSPRRFGYDQQTGAFVYREQPYSLDGIDLKGKYPNKFIYSRPRVNGDVPCREGLVRVLMWAALFRNWDLTDWLKLGETVWKPWRTGMYKDGADQEDIDDLAVILDNMSASGVAIYPDTTEVKIEWPAGGIQRAHHAELFDVIGREMSKAVLGQTETTETSKGSGYAQAKVMNEVRKDLRENHARSIAADFTRDLIVPMTAINFGPGVRPSALRFVTEDVKDLSQFANGVNLLVAAGTEIPQSWVQDQAGIPQPLPGEPILQPRTNTTPPGGQPPPSSKPPADAEDGDDNETTKPPPADTVDPEDDEELPEAAE